MTNEIIQHYSIRKLSIGAVSVIVGSFFLTSGQTVHADTMNDANSIQTQSNNNKSAESKEIDTKQLATDQTKTEQPFLSVTKVESIKKANTSIMPKSKITLNNKKLATNKIQLYDQSVTNTKLHKTATLLPQMGEDKGTVIGIIGVLAILLALISLKKPKENKKD